MGQRPPGKLHGDGKCDSILLASAKLTSYQLQGKSQNAKRRDQQRAKGDDFERTIQSRNDIGSLQDTAHRIIKREIERNIEQNREDRRDTTSTREFSQKLGELDRRIKTQYWDKALGQSKNTLQEAQKIRSMT